MEIHRKKLFKLCRFCAKVVQLKKGYQHAKTVQDYEIVLATYFKISTNEDKDVSVVFFTYI